MPKISKKKLPSNLDLKVWKMAFLDEKKREQIAKEVGIGIVAVDYHIAEGKRLIGKSVSESHEIMRSLTVPVSFEGLQLVYKAFKTQDLKYLDGAIKWLRNVGVTIEQVDITHTLKDSRDASEDFTAVMDRLKNRAIDVTPSEPITAPQSDDPPKDDTEPKSSH